MLDFHASRTFHKSGKRGIRTSYISALKSRICFTFIQACDFYVTFALTAPESQAHS